MSVNGITNSAEATYSSYTAKKTAQKETQETKEDVGVVYESTSKKAETSSAKKTNTKVANPELVSKMKADMDARTSQLSDIVTKLISNQGSTIGKANDMWRFLAGGNFTVDAQTKAQAQADIAEDGYWGVEATSDRIIDFAKALAGDDPDQLEKMRAAFEKGFKQATKTWGGKLPDISQKTYEAIQKKFDALTKTNTAAEEEVPE